MRGAHTIGGNNSEFSKERLASGKRTVPMLNWKEDRKTKLPRNERNQQKHCRRLIMEQRCQPLGLIRETCWSRTWPERRRNYSWTCWVVWKENSSEKTLKTRWHFIPWIEKYSKLLYIADKVELAGPCSATTPASAEVETTLREERACEVVTGLSLSRSKYTTHNWSMNVDPQFSGLSEVFHAQFVHEFMNEWGWVEERWLEVFRRLAQPSPHLQRLADPYANQRTLQDIMLSKRKESPKMIHCRIRRLPTSFVYYSMRSVKVLAWIGEIFWSK